MSVPITPEIVGNFIDSVAGKVRTPAAVVGRLIEEVVELGLAAGLTPEQISGHVNDSIFNQCTKISQSSGATCFPSRHGSRPSFDDLIEESADVSLLLKDLCHVAGLSSLDLPERTKWAAFIKKDLWASPKGVVYARKPHIK